MTLMTDLSKVSSFGTRQIDTAALKGVDHEQVGE